MTANGGSRIERDGWRFGKLLKEANGDWGVFGCGSGGGEEIFWTTSENWRRSRERGEREWTNSFWLG